MLVKPWVPPLALLSESLWALPLVLQSAPSVLPSERPSVTPLGKLWVLRSGLPWELQSLPLSGSPCALALVRHPAPAWVMPSALLSVTLSVRPSVPMWALPMEPPSVLPSERPLVTPSGRPWVLQLKLP